MRLAKENMEGKKSTNPNSLQCQGQAFVFILRVMKATAKNIIPGEATSTVAVKMLKGSKMDGTT